MSAEHVHVIDGRQVTFPIDTCPICHPELNVPKSTGAKVYPRCYTKGNTIVTQASAGLMSTTTWWAEGNAMLHSVRRITRDGQQKVLIGSDGKPLWTQLTMRLSLAIAKMYRDELSKLIHTAENEPKPSDAPERK